MKIALSALKSIPKNGNKKVKENLLRINSRTNHLHTEVSLCVVPAHPNPRKKGKDVLDQRCSALTVKNMVISVVRPFVKGKRIRNLHAELTMTVKHHQ